MSDLELEDPCFAADSYDIEQDCRIDDQQTSSSSDDEISQSFPSPQQNRGCLRSRVRSRSRFGMRGCHSRRRSNSKKALRKSFGRDGTNQLSDEENEWVECEFEPHIVALAEPAYLPVDRSLYCKMDYIREYINDDLIKNIVDKSNISYLARTGKKINLTFTECYTYIAITMIMSVINYPTLRMYWSNKFRVPVIANNMPRNRFFLLRNSLKLVFDDYVTHAERRQDRLWKVRPLLDAILKGCKMQEKTKDISVNEMIIPFQGMCAFKQHCPGKPNPAGLKAIVLTNTNGLVCDFDIYQGTTTYPDYENTNFCLGEKAVLSLTEDLVPGHVIYCDRHFTRDKLILALRDKGIMCVGALMKNRIPNSARDIVTDDKVMKKMSRESLQVVVNKAKHIVITKWIDNKPITFMSNIYAAQTLDSCKRWSKKENKYYNIPIPEVVQKYNTNMRGADIANRMLAVCQNRYRTKKWTQRFFSHMMDLAVSNSWILYKHNELNKGIRLKNIQQLQAFKLEIAETIIGENIEIQAYDSSNEDADSDKDLQSSSRNRNGPVPLPSETYRNRGAVHLPMISATQKRCRKEKCHKKTSILCIKCNIHLCLTKERNCFKKNFHNLCSN